MKLSEKQQIFTWHIGQLIMFANARDYKITFGHAFRSPEEQRRLVNDGKSQTMNSNHLKRLAVDFNVFINGRLTWDWHKIKPLGDYWESLNPGVNRWGGDWNGNDKKDGFIDSPHFEANY